MQSMWDGSRVGEGARAGLGCFGLLPFGWLLLGALVLGLSPFAEADSPVSADAIVGVWASAPSSDGIAHVEIYRNGDGFDGRIVWLEKPRYRAGDRGGMAGQTKIDRENPDPQLRDRPLLGLKILDGFEFDGEGTWGGAQIYDPDSGKTYRSKAWLEGPDRLGLRGYLGISLLGRNTVWTRVQDSIRSTQAGG
ncbi:MAG: DUF2147 domain-containing protein [Acidobacteriota bacterium]